MPRQTPKKLRAKAAKPKLASLAKAMKTGGKTKKAKTR